MNNFDIKRCLDSMVILVDTREQQTDRAKARYASFGCPWRRSTLSYGDYGYNCILPDGTWLYDEKKTVRCHAVVERKMSLGELASCLGHERDRFEREFTRARDVGARIFLLVENASWESLIAGKYKSQMNPKAFLASVAAWMIRYDLNLFFCKDMTSGVLIREILYRDLKERLERGEIDDFGGNQGKI